MKRTMLFWLTALLCAILACGELYALGEGDILEYPYALDMTGTDEAELSSMTYSENTENSIDVPIDLSEDPSELLDATLSDIVLEDTDLQYLQSLDEAGITFEATGPVSANDGNTVEYDGIRYEITDTGAVVKGLAEGNTSVTELTFPSIVEGHAVTRIDARAFSGCDSLSILTVPGNIKVIGDSAFSDCISLESVALEAGVEEIGSNAFNNCIILTRIAMNPGLKTINYGTFSGCPLTELLFPDSVTTINPGALKSESLCKNVKKVRWPEGIPSIPDEQFENYAALEEVILPDSLINIGKEAFSRCERLYSIQLPNALTAIGASAFAHCTDLKALAIPGRIGIIYDGTFYNTGLSTATVPGNVKIIGDSAFSHCNQLTTVVLEAGVEEIGAGAFSYCEKLKQVTMNDGLKGIGNNVFHHTVIEELLFPDSVIELGSIYPRGYNDESLKTSLKKVRWPSNVTTIPGEFFKDLAALENVIIPDSLTDIGSHAFENCSSLKTLRIPPRITSIQPYTFAGSGLLSMTVPGSVKTIGSYAFQSCSKLTDVLLEAGVEEIGAYAFSYCGSVKSLKMASGLKIIKDAAFFHCSVPSLQFPNTVTELDPMALNLSDHWGGNILRSSLKKVRWPAGVKEIPASQFSGFSVLQEVTIAKGVRHIGNYAFNECSALTTINFPSNAITLGEGAFTKAGLKKLTIPGTIKVVSQKAFSDCDSLTSVVLNAGVEEIDERAFSLCEKLKLVILPYGLKTIKSEAFYNSPLNELSLPDTVTVLEPSAINKWDSYSGNVMFGTLKKVRWTSGIKTIPESLFSGFSTLQEITIPNGVTSIGASAFSDCAALKTVNFPTTKLSIGPSAFAKSGLKTLTIPGNVKTIGTDAFKDCDKLTSVMLKEGVTEIGEGAFSQCDVLRSVTMNKGLKRVKYSAFSYSPLASLSFPDTVTELHPGAINIDYNQTGSYYDIYGDYHPYHSPDAIITASLKKVRWPAGVQTVPDYQFNGFVKLKEVTLPNGVNKINANAFKGCAGLRIATVKSKSLLSIDGSAFTDVDLAKLTFTVPNCKGMAKVMKYLKKKSYMVSVTKHASVVVDPAVKATYTKTGLTEGKHCKECGEVLVKQKVVPKLVRKPKSVKLDKKGTVTLAMGNKLTLKATVTPKDAKTTLTWSSSNKKIATVNKSGVVTPVAKGTATITVKTSNNKSASVKVKVIGPKPKSVTIKQGKKATMKVGEKLTLKAVLSPAKAETKLTWSTSNKKVLTVSDKGVVTAVKTGTATVTVKTGNGKTASIVIRVQKTRT